MAHLVDRGGAVAVHCRVSTRVPAESRPPPTPTPGTTWGREKPKERLSTIVKMETKNAVTCMQQTTGPCTGLTGIDPNAVSYSKEKTS